MPAMNHESNLTDQTLTSEIKLYYDLNLPEARPAPLLIALHGYGANKRQMMREARQIAPDGFAIASLQGFHQHLKDPKEAGGPLRSEEHTSELQSQSNLVCRLLLEKKKKKRTE